MNPVIFKQLVLLSLFLLFSLSIVGCTANGQKYNNDSQVVTKQSKLYIYRPFSLICSAFSPEVYLDEEYIGFISNAGYLKLNVSNGQHSIRIGKLTTSLNISNNNNAYLKFNHGWNLFFLYPLIDYNLIIVNKDIALNEIKETHYSN